MDHTTTPKQVYDKYKRTLGRAVNPGKECREFCQEMYGAIREELVQNGRSPYLEDLRQTLQRASHRGSEIKRSAQEYVEFLAVWYLKLDMADHDDSQTVERHLHGPTTGMEWVDGMGRRSREYWDELLSRAPSCISIAMYLEFVDALIHAAKADYAARQRAEATPPRKPGSIVIHGGEDGEPPVQGSEGRTPPAAPERTDPEAARLLEEATRKDREAQRKLDDADALLKRLQSEVDRNKTLREQVDALLENNNQAESILQSAKAAAEKLTGEAKKTRETADKYFEDKCIEAQGRVGEILEEARTEARESAAGLMKRYLRSEIAGETSPETCFPIERAEEVRLTKEMVKQGAFEIERNLRDVMNSLKHDLQEQLDSWRRNLYGQEYGPLAEYYQTLYRQLGSGSKTIQAIVSQIDRLESGENPSEQDLDLLRRLRSLQKELSGLVEQLGKVMGGLGLEIVLPKQGDPFDRELHIDEEAESGTETVGGVIDTVRFPAVCGRDAAGYRIPIRTAAVTIKQTDRGDSE